MRLFQVDAFTDKAFAGNPAAVCIMEELCSAEWMQNVAKEISRSETAFLLAREGDFDLRWFTPRTEVELCGHATLASAHVLWQEGYLARDATARLHTLSGLLTCESKEGWIELNFPNEAEEKSLAPAGLIEALAVQPKYVGKNRFDYLVEVESEEIVRNIKPDYKWLAEVPMRGVIVTSAADSQGFDFVSRFFAPGVGIDEDPVTGSAHCCLGPFWQKRLGKDRFVAYQASERGGILKVRLAGDRVLIAGKAVTVFRGDLLV